MSKPVSALTQFQTDFPFANLVSLDNNFTSLLAAVNDSLTYANYLLDTSGAANTINVAFSAGISCTLTAGLLVQVRVANTSTGATQLNINSLGLVPVINPDGSAISANQLLAGGVYQFQYNGSNFVVLGSWVSPALGRTAAETSAGVTPVNYAYQPGDLRRYGGVGDGLTDSTTPINNWIATILAGTAGRLPAGTYVYNGQLAINLSTGSASGGIRFTGDGVGISILKIVTATSPALSIGNGNQFYFIMENMSVQGALDGVLVAFGSTSYTDAINGADIRCCNFKNTNNTANAVAVQCNTLFNCRLFITANCGGSTARAALQVAQSQFNTFQGSFSTANVGVEYPGTGIGSDPFAFGNVFIAPDIEVVNYCFKISSEHATRNTVIGGQFVWATYGITATQGGTNEFLNINPSSGVATLVDPANNVGVVIPENGIGQSNFANIFAGTNSGDCSVQINTVAGSVAHLQLRTGGSLRWDMQRNNAADGAGNTGSNFQLVAYANDGVTVLGNYLSIQRSNAACVLTGPLGINGNGAPTQVTGWGTPTGGAVITNFPGAGATLLQTSEVVAQLLHDLKAFGLYGA